MIKSWGVNSTRTALAFIVLVLGMVGVVLLGYIAMTNASDKDKTSQMVFTAVLPLLGTWVGAVLAYYFSRDNLQAGSQTTIDAVKSLGRSGSTGPVTDYMTPLARIQPLRQVADEAAANALPLADLYAVMQGSGNSRVPVLTQSNVAIYVIHEPDIDKYAQKRAASSANLAAAETVQALTNDPDIGPQLTAFVGVSPTATLEEARRACSVNIGTKDVFVTTDGQRTSPVIGWLTNSDLARQT